MRHGWKKRTQQKEKWLILTELFFSSFLYSWPPSYYSIVLYTDFNCSNINGIRCTIDAISVGLCRGDAKCEVDCKMVKSIIGMLFYVLWGQVRNLLGRWLPGPIPQHCSGTGYHRKHRMSQLPSLTETAREVWSSDGRLYLFFCLCSLHLYSHASN